MPDPRGGHGLDGTCGPPSGRRAQASLTAWLAFAAASFAASVALAAASFAASVAFATALDAGAYASPAANESHSSTPEPERLLEITAMAAITPPRISNPIRSLLIIVTPCLGSSA